MAQEKKVIDASVVIKWFVHEEGEQEALSLLKKHRENEILLVVPELIFLETINVLRYKSNDEEFLSEVNKTLWESEFHVEKLNSYLLEKASIIALQNNLSVYDALYVAIAQISGAELITADKDFKKLPNVRLLGKK